MICPDKVRDVCLFGTDCPREAVVDDDWECAAYIRSVQAMMNAKVAPQEEWGDPVEAAELEQEREAIQEEALPQMMRKAPLWCRIVHRLTWDSPSARMLGCKLGCREFFRRDCSRCPEYVNRVQMICEGFREGLRAGYNAARKLAEEAKRECDHGADV